MPVKFSRANPPSAANSKHGVEEGTSWDQKERSGSVNVLWMFRSRTTESGTPVSEKSVSGGKEWTLRSVEFIE